MSKLIDEASKIESVEHSMSDFWKFKSKLTPNAINIYGYVIKDLDFVCQTMYDIDGRQAMLDLKVTRRLRLGKISPSRHPSWTSFPNNSPAGIIDTAETS